MSDGNAWEVLRSSLRLGLTSFGGPIAHLHYFEQLYVRDKRWLTETQFSSIVGLCQVLPGPASSQAGFLIGLHRAGWAGAAAAWIGFTLPSALLLYLFAHFATRIVGPDAEAALHGLKIVAVAVVAQAVLGMARRLCVDRATIAIAATSAIALGFFGGGALQLAVIAFGGTAGLIWCKSGHSQPSLPPWPAGRRAALLCAGILAALMVGLPWLAWLQPSSLLALADVFFRAGALVFGGGHVVLPLLHEGLVPAGWVSDDAFLAGYGLAQAVPGPLFTVAAFLGAQSFASAPALAATVAIVFVFLPGLLLAIIGAALWQALSRHARVHSALSGINAAVVGILGAAFYDPVMTTALLSIQDIALALLAWWMLERVKVPPLAIVGLCVVGSMLLARA